MPVMTRRHRLLIAAPLAGILVAAVWWHPDSRHTPMTSPAPATNQAEAVLSGRDPVPGTTPTGTSTPWRETDARQLAVTAATVAELELACAQQGTPIRAAPTGTPAARYCAYRQALAALPVDASTPASMEQSLQDLMNLRRRHFDAGTAAALFGAEEAQTRYTLAALRIRSDNRLSDDEKDARLSALRRELPSPAAELETPRPADATDWLATQSLADARLQRERSAAIQKDWNRRYQAFRQQKEIILAAGLSAADKAIQVEALLQQHYDANEMAAAKAYDTAHTTPQTPGPDCDPGNCYATKHSR